MTTVERQATECIAWFADLGRDDVAVVGGKGVNPVSVNPDAVDAARHAIARAERRLLLAAARRRDQEGSR